MGQIRNAYSTSDGRIKKRSPKQADLVGRIILKWISNK
jgi:hypothetical protein